MASLTGPADAVQALLADRELPAAAELLGPVEDAAGQHPDAAAGAQVSRAGAGPGTAQAQAARSARKEPGAVRVQLDPAELI